ncbi:hypothetical protein ACQPW1_09600 [Nocardia sp. CA-128927]|uniref:hypothetical protein n=1 Tax=Nocardia sp. CA-128927 TaxID=3239975 RepID=UPI003D997226
MVVVTGVIVVVATGAVVVVTGDVAVVVAGVVVTGDVVVVVTGGVVAVGASVVDWTRAGAHVPVVPSIDTVVAKPGPAAATPTANPAKPSSAATIKAMIVVCRTAHRRTMPSRVGFREISAVLGARIVGSQLFCWPDLGIIGLFFL